MHDYDFYLEANKISTNDATVVSLVVEEPVHGEKIVVTGTSRRSPEDRYDAEVALYYAYGRALEVLAQKFLKRADGKMRHNDQLREKQLTQRGIGTVTPSLEAEIRGQEQWEEWEKNRKAQWSKDTEGLKRHLIKIGAFDESQGATIKWVPDNGMSKKELKKQKKQAKKRMKIRQNWQD